MGEPTATGTGGPPPSWLTQGLGATNPNTPQAGPNINLLQALQDQYNSSQDPAAKAAIASQMSGQGAPAKWPTPTASPLMPVSPSLFNGLQQPANPQPNDPSAYMQQLIDALQQRTASRLLDRSGPLFKGTTQGEGGKKIKNGPSGISSTQDREMSR